MAVAGGFDLSFRRLGGVWILHSIHFCPTMLSAPFLAPFAMLTQQAVLLVKHSVSVGVIGATRAFRGWMMFGRVVQPSLSGCVQRVAACLSCCVNTVSCLAGVTQRTMATATPNA